MNFKTVITAVIAVLVIGIFTWLLVLEKNRTGTLTSDLAEAQRRAGQAGDEVARLQDMTTRQQRDIATLTTRNQELETSALNVQERLNQMETATQGTERLLAAAREEADNLRGEAERLRAEERSARTRAEDMARNESALKEQLSQAEARIKVLEESIQVSAAPADGQTETAMAVQCPPPVVCPEISLEEKERALAEAARLKLEVSKTEAELNTLRQQLGRDHDRLAEMKRELALVASEKEAAHEEAKTAREAYDRITRDLKSLISTQELVISELKDQLSLTFMDKIFFAPGSATLTPDGARVLDSVGEALKGLNDKKIMVVGHTDDQPIAKSYQRIFPSNWELSAARAGAVIRYFQEKGGLSPESLEAVGRAFYDPVAPNDTPENRQKNRRVEIIISNRPATNGS